MMQMKINDIKITKEWSKANEERWRLLPLVKSVSGVWGICDLAAIISRPTSIIHVSLFYVHITTPLLTTALRINVNSSLENITKYQINVYSSFYCPFFISYYLMKSSIYLSKARVPSSYFHNIYAYCKFV